MLLMVGFISWYAILVFYIYIYTKNFFFLNELKYYILLELNVIVSVTIIDLKNTINI